MTVSDRVRVKNVNVLSGRHYRVHDVEVDYRRGNGEWPTPIVAPKAMAAPS